MKSKSKLEKDIIIPNKSDDISTKDVVALTKIYESSNLLTLVEAITGLVGKSKSEIFMTTGRLIQALIKGEGVKQLAIEINELREQGKIDEERLESKYGKKGFIDLLKLIDQENEDPLKFKAIKTLFFASIEKGKEEKLQMRDYYIMQSCFELSAFDLEVLIACYQIYKDPNHPALDISGLGIWFDLLNKKLGYGLSSQVGRSEKTLIAKGFLSDRIYNDKSGIKPGNDFRLTTDGILLCDLIAF